MKRYYYVTPSDYAVAEANGIKPDTIRYRTRELGWDIDRAISTKTRPVTDRSLWAEIAKQNGIKYQTFIVRVNHYGWSEERAATEPIYTTETKMKKATETRRKYSKEMYALAESNGISARTFRRRVKEYGMSEYEAATKPPVTRKEMGKMGAEARKRLYGGFIFGKKYNERVYGK